MGKPNSKEPLSIVPVVVSVALVPLLCAGAGLLLIGPRTAALRGLPSPQGQEILQVADREGPAAQEGQEADGQEAPQAASHGFTEERVNGMTDEQIEYSNEKAASNPAIARIVRKGDAEAVPLENVDNIVYLSSLPQDNIDRSLLYIGDFLAGRGYDPQTVRISILEGIEDSVYGYETFFFQVEGEDTVFAVSAKDPEYDWPASVHDTADQRFLRMVMPEYKRMLERRGFL